MQDRASPEVKPGGNCEVRASSKIVLKPSYPCSGMTSREQQGVEMKLKRMDRQETIWRARKRLPAPACRKQGVSSSPILFRQAQHLPGRRYCPRI